MGLANDTVNGEPATPENVVLTEAFSTDEGITLNVTDGSVNVAAGTPVGTYTLTYQICDRTAPAVCDQATVSVTVEDSTTFHSVSDVSTTTPSVSPTTLPDTTQPTCVTALKCAGDPIVLAMPSSGAIVLSAPMLLGRSETCGQNVMFSPPMLTCGDGGVQEVEVFVGSEQEQCRVTVTDPMGVCGSGGTTTTVSSVSPTTLPDTTQPTCVTALKCAGDPIVLAMPSSGAIVLSAQMLLGT